MTLVGQIALLVGLVLQLDRLWHDNRESAAKLDNVDEQLHDLKASTTLLGASQGPAASVFYSHFAGGAGPQLLLTDLKSQIDLLAMKIAQDRTRVVGSCYRLTSPSLHVFTFPGHAKPQVDAAAVGPCSSCERPTRAQSGKLFHAPPRRTRRLPESGPCGSSTGEWA